VNKTSIEWCFDGKGKVGSGYTWNPTRGCSKDDEDCKNCYAMRIAARFSGPGGAFEGFAKMGKKGPQWTGKLALLEDKIADPLRCRDDGAWVFVNSMSDLFHRKLPDRAIDQVVAAMMLATHLKFVVLTKRTDRAAEYFRAPGLQARWHTCANELRQKVKGFNGGSVSPPDQLPPHIWWGMSAGNQATFDKRVDGLLAMPGRHVLSLEPLIGPINIKRALWRHQPERGATWSGAPFRTRLEWVIVGAESGPGRRPAQVDWARQIRDQCHDREASGLPVTFFLKQWALADSIVVNGVGGELERAITVPHPNERTSMLSVPYLDGVQWATPPRTFATDGGRR
jgi:protein gp37